MKVAFFSILVLGSCSGPVRPEDNKESRSKPVISRKAEVPAKVFSCEEVLLAMVKSGNLKVLQDFPEMLLRIDDVSEEKITIQLYNKDISDRTGQVRQVENTVGWLEFFPGSGKLMDITADPEAPVEVHYDTTILSGHDLFKSCGISKHSGPEKQRQNNGTLDSQWSGSYHFSAHNRDGRETAFDIIITTADDITVQYTDGGERPQVFRNIKATMMDADKIRIPFNPQAEEMGTIYLQKSGGGYLISGSPVYFINPGNEDFPLQKIR